MSCQQLTPEEIISNAVGPGRAYVSMVKTADALIDRQPFWTEKFLSNRNTTGIDNDSHL